MHSKHQRQAPYFAALRERVARVGCNKRELVKRCAFDPDSVAAILSGRSYPDPESALTLAAALGCTLESMAYDVELGDALVLESQGAAIRAIQAIRQLVPDPVLRKAVQELYRQMEEAAEREAARTIERVK